MFTGRALPYQRPGDEGVGFLGLSLTPWVAMYWAAQVTRDELLLVVVVVVVVVVVGRRRRRRGGVAVSAALISTGRAPIACLRRFIAGV